MRSSHFDIFGLLEFAAHNPQIFGAEKKRPAYAKKVRELLENVPDDCGGWYLWGKFNDMGWWETIYLGKAGKRKIASLRSRLSEEMKDEAISFWASVYGREVMIKQHKKRYGNKYDTTRSLRKIGAHFVIWIAADSGITEEEIEKQEKILIRIFRPTHNAQRGGRAEAANDLTMAIEDRVEQELAKILSFGR